MFCSHLSFCIPKAIFKSMIINIMSPMPQFYIWCDPWHHMFTKRSNCVGQKVCTWTWKNPYFVSWKMDVQRQVILISIYVCDEHYKFQTYTRYTMLPARKRNTIVLKRWLIILQLMSRSSLYIFHDKLCWENRLEKKKIMQHPLFVIFFGFCSMHWKKTNLLHGAFWVLTQLFSLQS